MKKNLLWMLAAILFCGLTTTVFTACGSDDDDDNKPNSGQQDDNGKTPESTTYDVTFTVVAPSDVFDIVSYDFTYADDKGNKFTKEIDADMPNESLTEQEKADLNTFIKTAASTMPTLPTLFSNTRAQHFTLKNLPTGSKVNYELVMHLNSDYMPAEGETISFAHPAINVAQTPKNGTKTIISNYETRIFSFKDTKWQEFLSRMEGRKLIDIEVTVGQKSE